MIVLAPNSVQEMLEFPRLAFDLAFKYRNPVLILADAFLGQLKEDITMAPNGHEPSYDISWATLGSKNHERHILNSLHLENDVQEEHEKHLHEKFSKMHEEARAESFQLEDSDIVIVSYGIASRISKKAVKIARSEGLKVGLLRPITLNPFPNCLMEMLSRTGKRFLVVELNAGQMVQDVALATGNAATVEHFGRLGGNVPTPQEIVSKAKEIIEK